MLNAWWWFCAIDDDAIADWPNRGAVCIEEELNPDGRAGNSNRGDDGAAAEVEMVAAPPVVDTCDEERC